MDIVQSISRAFYRAFVVAMMFLLWDNKAIYGLPIGLLVGLCSEITTLTKK